MSISNLIRPNLKNFTRYKAVPTLEEISKEIGLPIEKILKLDTSYNPYLPDFYPPEIVMKVDKLSYPDPLSLNLRRELKNYTDYEVDWLACGNGSDELIEVIIRAFVDPGESILICPPTFPMYEISAKIQGVEVQKVPRDDNFELDINSIISEVERGVRFGKMLNSKTPNSPLSRGVSPEAMGGTPPPTKVIFIDSPANPVGTTIKESDLKELLKKDIIVVIDEAYYEFCDQELTFLVREFPNLILLRTFSKWAGIAGLRVGYMIANPEIIDVINKIKQPYNVNSVAQELAVWALQNQEKFQQSLQELLQGKDYFIKQMSQFADIRIISGQGSYLTLQLKERSSEELLEFLKSEGVLLRKVSQPEIPNAIRSNLAKRQDVDRVVTAIGRFYSWTTNNLDNSRGCVTARRSPGSLKALAAKVGLEESLICGFFILKILRFAQDDR